MADNSAPQGLMPNASFDPYTQTVVLLMPDGITQSAVPIDSIVFLQQLAVSTGIIYGCHIGICGLLMMVMLLMTRTDKFRSIVFILNMASLLFLFVRGILMAVSLNGPLFNWYNFVNGYYEHIDGALTVSVTVEVFSFLSCVAIELSLLFQTQIVCCTLKSRYRHPVTFFCSALALATISVRFATMVLNADWGIINVNSTTETQWNTINHLENGYNICLMCSIILLSGVFCAKLGHAIIQRHKMGLKQFGPMQIIFVMGCQTLCIPVIFGILSFWVLPHSQLYTLMPAVVAMFLPLSSIWASTSTSKNNNIAAPRQWHDRISPEEKSRATYATDKQLLKSDSSSNNKDTHLLVSEPRGESVASSKTKKMGHHASASRDSIDVELAKMGHRIQVDRSYTVRSD